VPDHAVDERAALSGLLAPSDLQVGLVDAERISQRSDDFQNVDQLLGRPARGGRQELVDLLNQLGAQQLVSLGRSGQVEAAGLAAGRHEVGDAIADELHRGCLLLELVARLVVARTSCSRERRRMRARPVCSWSGS
jgi:hypothetical protein